MANQGIIIPRIYISKRWYFTFEPFIEFCNILNFSVLMIQLLKKIILFYRFEKLVIYRWFHHVRPAGLTLLQDVRFRTFKMEKDYGIIRYSRRFFWDCWWMFPFSQDFSRAPVVKCCHLMLQKSDSHFHCFHIGRLLIQNWTIGNTPRNQSHRCHTNQLTKL